MQNYASEDDGLRKIPTCSRDEAECVDIIFVQKFEYETKRIERQPGRVSLTAIRSDVKILEHCRLKVLVAPVATYRCTLRLGVLDVVGK